MTARFRALERDAAGRRERSIHNPERDIYKGVRGRGGGAVLPADKGAAAERGRRGLDTTDFNHVTNGRPRRHPSKGEKQKSNKHNSSTPQPPRANSRNNERIKGIRTDENHADDAVPSCCVFPCFSLCLPLSRFGRRPVAFGGGGFLPSLPFLSRSPGGQTNTRPCLKIGGFCTLQEKGGERKAERRKERRTRPP